MLLKFYEKINLGKGFPLIWKNDFPVKKTQNKAALTNCEYNMTTIIAFK